MNNDAISKRAVINELFDIAKDVNKCEQIANDNIDSARVGACKATLIEIRARIAKLPTTQTVIPEPLTDMEQRIFLAAMSREEKVCKKVDELWRDSREPYEDSLVRTCHEITRKVKKALWTN